MKIDFTPELARAVIELTAHPKWGVFRTMYNSRREKVREVLETSSDNAILHRSQGQAEEIRHILTLREKAEAFLQTLQQTREDSL